MSKRKRHEPRVPLPQRGGIRAQGTRSAAGRPWWSRRWMLMLEGLRLGARLGRGRSYAAAGQVAALALGEGTVGAVVQGGGRDPYRVTFAFRTLTGTGRAAVAAALAAHPAWLGRLLVNDLPPGVEEIFRQAAVPLFPERRGDWICRCTCPDWSKPCKHGAAVLFLLGEAVEREPVLLLELRGLNRGDLIPGADTAAPAAPADADAGAGAPGLDADPAAFWGDRWTPAESFGPAPGRGVPAPLATRLGPLPFWRGQERFRDLLEQVYGRAGPMALHVWSGERLAVWRPVKAAPDDAAFALRRRRLRIDHSV